MSFFQSAFNAIVGVIAPPTYDNEIQKILIDNKNKKVMLKDNPSLLNKTINQFHISASHNTYLSGLQHLSYSTDDQIQKVLDMGARAIELDIKYMKKDGKSYPFVAHGTKDYITTGFLDFQDAIDVIGNFVLKDTKGDPIILFLEIFNPDDKIGNAKLKEIILKKLKARMIRPHVDILTQPISNLLGKILIRGTPSESNVLDDLYDRFALTNYDDEDSRALRDTSKDKIITRIYKRGSFDSFLSNNVDFNKFKNLNKNMTTMNFQTSDKYLLDHFKFFKTSSYILMD